MVVRSLACSDASGGIGPSSRSRKMPETNKDVWFADSLNQGSRRNEQSRSIIYRCRIRHTHVLVAA